jgi:hypothetical protein
VFQTERQNCGEPKHFRNGEFQYKIKEWTNPSGSAVWRFNTLSALWLESADAAKHCKTNKWKIEKAVQFVKKY